MGGAGQAGRGLQDSRCPSNRSGSLSDFPPQLIDCTQMSYRANKVKCMPNHELTVVEKLKSDTLLARPIAPAGALPRSDRLTALIYAPYPVMGRSDWRVR